jgi:hypothetical protein
MRYPRMKCFWGQRSCVLAHCDEAHAACGHRPTSRPRPINQDEYVRQVLDAYRKTPRTTGTARRSDRLLAAQLYQRGAPLAVVENALVLAAARRLIRPAEAAIERTNQRP